MSANCLLKSLADSVDMMVPPLELHTLVVAEKP